MIFDPVNDSAPSLFVDGSSVTVTPAVGSYSYNSSYNDSGADLVLGARTSNADKLKGAIKETVIYNSDQSANRVALETNINNQYDIY